MKRGEKEGKGFSFSEIMLWISLEQRSVFGLAWRLADDRGRWSWKRVINKHFNRAGERCRPASGLGPSLGWLASLQVTLHEQTLAHQHCTVCVYVCVWQRDRKRGEKHVLLQQQTPEGLMMTTSMHRERERISILLHKDKMFHSHFPNWKHAKTLVYDEKSFLSHLNIKKWFFIFIFLFF